MPQGVKNQHLSQGSRHVWMDASPLHQNGYQAGWKSGKERNAAENVQGPAPPINSCTITG